MKGYIERADELLEEAKRFKQGRPRDCGYYDNKRLLNNPDDITALIGAHARILELNTSTVGNVYKHEVVYRGHKFIGVTDTLLIVNIRGSCRF